MKDAPFCCKQAINECYTTTSKSTVEKDYFHACNKSHGKRYQSHSSSAFRQLKHLQSKKLKSNVIVIVKSNTHVIYFLRKP